MRIKPNCLKCKRPYLGGKDGVCENCCLERPPRKKLKRLLCQCGKVAVVVLLAEVLNPQEEPIVVEIPLCTYCLELERELELEIASTRNVVDHKDNPIRIIVVKNLPRPRRPLSGRKF